MTKTTLERFVSVDGIQVMVSPRWRPVWLASVVTAGVGLCVLLAVGISEGKIWVPDCGFRRIVGVPCPGCGATGSLTFIASGQWWSAMKSSPLVALSVVMALFAVPLTLVNAVSSRSCVFSNRLGRARLCWIMAGLVFANWAYLILVG